MVIMFTGPKNTTVSDMWRMIWQLNTNRVVMVTQLEEDGMVYLYWSTFVHCFLIISCSFDDYVNECNTLTNMYIYTHIPLLLLLFIQSSVTEEV